MRPGRVIGDDDLAKCDFFADEFGGEPFGFGHGLYVRGQGERSGELNLARRPLYADRPHRPEILRL